MCPYCEGEWVLGVPTWTDDGFSIVIGSCQVCGAVEAMIRHQPDPERLDEMVIDAKLKEASSINNQGWEKQIKYLKEAGFLPGEKR